MPAFYTHKLFAQKVYNNFSNSLKEKIDYDYYLLFAQSFDILFYNFGRKKWLFALGHSAHRKNTQAFFLNTLNVLDKNSSSKYFLSFFYGTLTHYVLDSTFHPYIFYKSGIFKKEDKTTWQYKGLHTKLEMEIDKYFYEKEHQTPFYKEKFYKMYDNVLKPDKDLIAFIDEVFAKTFYKENIGSYYFKSLKNWRFIHKHFKYDPYGIKKFFYKILDVFPFSFKFQNYSCHLDNFKQDDLNLKKKTWLNPADTNITSNLSIDELFNKALNDYFNIIKNLNHVTNLRTTNFPIKNISYYSGLDLKLKKKLQYFEK